MLKNERGLYRINRYKPQNKTSFWPCLDQLQKTIIVFQSNRAVTTMALLNQEKTDKDSGFTED